LQAGSLLGSGHGDTGQRYTDQTEGVQGVQGISPDPSKEVLARVRGAKKLGADVGRWRKYLA
jgi:hypothetical protein